VAVFGRTKLGTSPRKAHGAPDLEGVWTNKTATPLERPAAFDALIKREIAIYGDLAQKAGLAQQ